MERGYSVVEGEAQTYFCLLSHVCLVAVVKRRCCSNQVAVEVFLSVVIARQHVEVVSVDLHVSAKWHVGGGEPFATLVEVLVLSSLQELSGHDTGVLLLGLVDGDGVVSQVERDDETTVDIFGNARVETGSESQDVLIVVEVLEEIGLRSVGHKLVDVTEGVLLSSHQAVVRGHLWGLGLSWAGRVLFTQFKMTLVLIVVVLLSVLVHSINLHDVAEGVDAASGVDLVTGKVVISDEGLAGLLNLAGVGKLLSAEEAGERIETIILVVSLTDLNGIVSQVIVDDERTVVGVAVETEHLSVVVQELLLGSNLATSKLLLEILEHEGITLGWDGDLGLVEGVSRESLGFGTGLSAFHHELSSVIISIVDSEDASVDSHIAANGEVVRHEGLLRAITLQDHVSIEEGALGDSRVHLLGLSDHDRLVFKVVENHGFSNSVVLKTALDNALFGV